MSDLEKEATNWTETVSVGIDDLAFQADAKNGTNSTSSTYSYPLDVTKIAVLSVITVLTVAGNLCVILAIFVRQMKMTRMYYFILHLSLADLLTAFFTLLPEIIWTSTLPHFYGGNVVCKSIKFLQMIGPYLSSYVLIMTAIDRFQAICYPLSNCTWTPRRSNIMIGIAWVISIALCVPQAIIFHGRDGNSCYAKFPEGWGTKAYVTWFAISNFFIPFVVLIFCYGRICHVIWDNFNSKTTSTTHLAAAAESGQGNDANRDAAGRNKRLVREVRRIFIRGTRLVRRRRRSPKVRMRWRSKMTTNNSSEHEHSSGEHGQGPHQARIVVEPPSNSSSSEEKRSKNSIRGQNRRRGLRDASPESESQEMRRQQQQQQSNLSPNSSAAVTFAPIASSRSRPESPVVTVANPRAHSVRGISRAKIKTVKLTVVVILGYIMCSMPFIYVQLWAAWGKPSDAILGSLTWLFWLVTLNSVVNPWIYMFFNANLFEALCKACCPFYQGGVRGAGSRRPRRGAAPDRPMRLISTDRTVNGFKDDDDDDLDDTTARPDKTIFTTLNSSTNHINDFQQSGPNNKILCSSSSNSSSPSPPPVKNTVVTSAVVCSNANENGMRK